MQQQCYKTKLCHFHARGRCFRGTECTFAHSEVELQCVPDLRKTKICHPWLNGTCYDKLCEYAHGNQELRPVPLNYDLPDIGSLCLNENSPIEKSQLCNKKSNYNNQIFNGNPDLTQALSEMVQSLNQVQNKKEAANVEFCKFAERVLSCRPELAETILRHLEEMHDCRTNHMQVKTASSPRSSKASSPSSRMTNASIEAASIKQTAVKKAADRRGINNHKVKDRSAGELNAESKGTLSSKSSKRGKPSRKDLSQLSGELRKRPQGQKAAGEVSDNQTNEDADVPVDQDVDMLLGFLIWAEDHFFHEQKREAPSIGKIGSSELINKLKNASESKSKSRKTAVVKKKKSPPSSNADVSRCPEQLNFENVEAANAAHSNITSQIQEFSEETFKKMFHDYSDTKSISTKLPQNKHTIAPYLNPKNLSNAAAKNTVFELSEINAWNQDFGLNFFFDQNNNQTLAKANKETAPVLGISQKQHMSQFSDTGSKSTASQQNSTSATHFSKCSTNVSTRKCESLLTVDTDANSYTSICSGATATFSTPINSLINPIFESKTKDLNRRSLLNFYENKNGSVNWLEGQKGYRAADGSKSFYDEMLNLTESVLQDGNESKVQPCFQTSKKDCNILKSLCNYNFGYSHPFGSENEQYLQLFDPSDLGVSVDVAST